MSFINNVQGAVNKDTGKYVGGLFDGMDAGLGNAMGAVGGAVGGIAGNAIAGGRESAAGNIIGGLGDMASAIPGPWGAIAGAGLKMIGGLTNAAFGVKLNQENINAVNNNISAMNSFQSNASDFDSLSQNFTSQPTSMRFNQSFIGKNGWFNKGATKKFNELQAQQDMAQQFVNNSLTNNMGNLVSSQNQNLLANYAAMGGVLPTQGSDWSTGLSYIDAGGSHESNPNNGVQMGIAPDGLPNLVEEGEVVWNNDYVFSKRLKVPKAFKQKYKIGKDDTPLSYADAAKAFNKEMEERPNDPISRRGRDANLTRLAQSQEEKRAKMQARQDTDDLLMQQAMMEQEPMIAAHGGKIHIKKSKRGTFTAAASKHGKSVQQFASQVLAHPENYSPAMRKKANFARNASKWRHDNGGHLYWDGSFFSPYYYPESAQYNPNLIGPYRDNDFILGDWNSPLNLDLNRATQRQELRYIGGKQYIPPTPDIISDPLYGRINIEQNVPKGAYNQHPLGNRVLQLDDAGFNALKKSIGAKASKYKTKEDLLLAAETGAPGTLYNGISNYFSNLKEPARFAPDKSLTAPGTLLSRVPSISAPTNMGVTTKGRWDALSNLKLGNTSNNNQGSSWLTGLRYVPAIGSAIGVFSDLMGWTNKPDYSNADAVLNASRGVRDVTFNPIGDYMTYTPFDRMFYLNQLNANAGATRRATLNTTAGNRGTAMAGILAADNNMMNSIGQMARQAEEYNLAQRQKVAEFNRATNMFNSEGFLKAQQANQGAAEVRMRAAQASAALRDAIDQRVGAARSANLTNLFDSLGDIGREEAIRNMINSNPAWYWTIGRDNNLGYKRANGGLITIKKRRK